MQPKAEQAASQNDIAQISPRPEEVLTDPELTRITSDFLAAAQEIDQQVAELAPNKVKETSYWLPAENFDHLVSDGLGIEDGHKVRQLSQSFAALSKRRGRDDYNASGSLLHEGVAMLALTNDGPMGREKARRRHGAHMPAIRRLVEFWQGRTIELSPQQMEAVKKAVLNPMSDLVVEIDKTVLSKSLSLSQADGMLRHLSGVDLDMDLAEVKFGIFNGIVEIFKRPEVRQAVARALPHNADDTNSTEVNLNDSELGPYFRATYFLDRMTLDESAPSGGFLSLLYHGHTSGRLMHVPSKQFRATYHELQDLSLMFRRVNWTEEMLSTLPKTIKNLESKHAKITDTDANELFLKAGDLLLEVYAAVAKRTNQKMDAISGREEIDAVMAESATADKFRVMVAARLLDRAKQLGIRLLPRYEAFLKDHLAGRGIEAQSREWQLEAELKQLEPEVSSRLAQFHEIDDLYQLSNNRLRERDPRLITLAKQLMNSISAQGPLDEATARNLIGLMVGVYWERTGQNASVQELADQYVKDIAQLRLLSGELDFLGKPQDSRLLKLTNLLDELIDSGLFDNPDDHPELEGLVDFVLHYIIARDRQLATAAPEAAVKAEEPKPESQQELVVPIETIRQAVQEDLLVFPPSATAREVISDYSKQISEKDLPVIEWERIRKIIELRDQFAKQGLEVNFIRTKHASWQVLPFFVLEVKLPNDEHAVAVVESPVYGNATYVFRESENRLPWRDVVQLTRQEARDWGAVPAIHVDSKRLDVHFNKVWNRVISELTVLR